MTRRVPFGLALMVLVLLPSPARAGLEDLVDVATERLADLTTAPQRAAGSVPADAAAIAPAAADWVPITGPVPGVLVRGTVADDPQARVLVRLPDAWNGKLVVAGAPGTRGELASDLVISDFVLQKGYAYVAQNKGMQNFVVPPAVTARSCPLLPVADFPSFPPNLPIDFFLLDAGNSMAEWGRRMHQAARIGQSVAAAHYGRTPARTYAMGVSNGGYQVRKAIEDYPQAFDGGVDWEGVYWRPDGPNFIGEIPAGLANYPAYRASGFDRTSAAAQAIEAAGWPPDLITATNTLWTQYRLAYWDLTQCLYVKEVDPTYNPGPGGFETFAAYDYRARPRSVARAIERIANSARVTRPLITVHGTLDALINIKGHARAYRDAVVAQGFGANYRLYEVQNGNHIELYRTLLSPRLELLQPHAHRAFELLEAWVERRETPPPSQCVPRGGTIGAFPAEPFCSSLLVP